MARGIEAVAWLAVATAVLAVPPGDAGEPASEQPSLAKPPALQPGHWWRVRVEDTLAGQTMQGTVVVASNDGSTVAFAVGSDSVHPLLFNYHLIPAATARLPDLAYLVHGEEFSPFRFPMAAGDSWPTVFDHNPVLAHVESANPDAATARIVYRTLAGAEVAEGTYDAAVGWFRSFSLGRTEQGYWATATVLAHGEGYSCESILPTALRLVELQAPRRDPSPVLAQSFEVPPTATHIALSMSVGADAAPARQQLLGPDGTVYQVNALPGEGHQSLLIVKSRPGGVWTSLTERPGGGYSATSASVFTAQVLAPFGQPSGDCAPSTAAAAAALDGGGTGPGEAGAWWRAAVVGLLALVRVRRRLFWVAAGLFTRLTPEAAADQPVRRRILDLLEKEQGLSTQEIRRALQIGWGTAVHHLAVLERNGRAVRSHTGGRVYWTRPGVACLPRPRGTAAAVLDAVTGSPGIGPSEVAARIGVRHSTVLYHAGRLSRAGRLRITADGHRRHYFPAVPGGATTDAP